MSFSGSSESRNSSLGDDQVGEMVFDRVSEEDDPLAQQARVDVGAFSRLEDSMTMGTSIVDSPGAARMRGALSRLRPARWTFVLLRISGATAAAAGAGSSTRGSAWWSGFAASQSSTSCSTRRLRRSVLRMKPGRAPTRSTRGGADRPHSARGPGRSRPRWPRRERRLLDVGDLRQHEERLDPLLGVRAEVGMEIGVGLLDDLEVGLFGDALARLVRNSSCRTSTS